MNSNITSDIYIESLKRKVEDKFGRVPNYPSDFEDLCLRINEMCRDTLSVSTLKRIWRYIEGWRVPRIATLDILAVYVGYKDFRDFTAACNIDSRVQSAYTDGHILMVQMLIPDSKLEIQWHPGRKVLLKYIGDFTFEVLHNEASKLSEGSKVRFTMLSEGHPLYADVTLPGSEVSRPYIAGSDTGITFKQI